MSNQAGYARNSNQPRSFYHSQDSMNSHDTARFLGSREMGPPSSFQTSFPAPRPIEIEVNNSRTLPNPSVTSSASWENFSAAGFGGSSEYGSSRPLSLDTQARSVPDPLQQWYNGNDGPWIPKGISSIPADRSQSRPRAAHSIPAYHGNQYRQPNLSDAGSLPYTVAPSDSGYGTRHSDENTSVFSAEINDRDQDCHSLVGQVTDYQPFQGHNDVVNVVMQQRDTRPSEHWLPLPSSSQSNAPTLVCQTCCKPVKTRSELKKHDLRHRKPFICNHPGCPRTDGFSTANDLERHQKSLHPSTLALSTPTKRYRCHAPGCKSREKSWPRLDNFRSHLKRVHGGSFPTEEDFENMIRRGEFLELPSATISHDVPQSRVVPFPDVSRAHASAIQNDSIQQGNGDPNWKQIPVFSASFDSAHHMERSKAMVSEGHEDSTTDGNAPIATMQPQKTVQPCDVYQSQSAPLAEVCNKPSLESILSAPVGNAEPETRPADQATPQPVVNASKPGAQSKVKLSNEETSDTTVTEAIITALVGAGVPEPAKVCSLHQDLAQPSLPERPHSCGASCETGPHTANHSVEPTSDRADNADNSAALENTRSLHQKKAIEVLRTLHKLGYIVQKNPSHTPRAKNPGSAASNKSEHLVTCTTCRRFTGRPCELRKHMRRHSRPYGCTFVSCNKQFGSKNDWKRHENSQHFHLETWRCDVEKDDGGTCAKVCYRKQSFQDHLAKDHAVSDPEILKSKTDDCRIGRNCQSRFWCGFCIKLIELTKKGVEAWTERFDHIDDHFMGRNGLTEQGIQDWVPVNGDKPKGNVEALSDQSPGSDSSSASSGSPEGNSPEDLSGVSKSVDQTNVPEESHKRRRSDDDSRPAKHQKTAQRMRTIIYCCHCQMSSNPEIDLRCNSCESSHLFCSSCVTEKAPDQDESPRS